MITIEWVLFPTPHGPPNITKCSPASTEKLNSKMFMSYVNSAFLEHASYKRTLTCLNGGIKMRLDLLVYLGKTKEESSYEKNSGPTHDHHYNPRSLPTSSFSYPHSLSYRLTLMPRFLSLLSVFTPALIHYSANL